GMKAMVIFNIASEADVANGTRGITVEGMFMDLREEPNQRNDSGIISLRYPPALVLFRRDTPTNERFEGLEAGLIPITPSLVTFTVETPDKKRYSIHRRQLAITPVYAFTEYNSQGQTIENVIVALADPPSSKLSPFSVCVALSRSRGRDTIRSLRGFNENLFTNHPSEDLRREDIRLVYLNVFIERRM
ncbi:hypothetical protein BD779DRAFT_1445852, partial [Infundibulicybe gibba]